MNRNDRQATVAKWVSETFCNLADVPERGRRMLEEAVELAQAVGVTREDAVRLVDYVFARPPGVPYQELGGAGMTLLALAQAVGISADDAEQVELERVLAKSREYFRTRQREKDAVTSWHGEEAHGLQEPPDPTRR